MGSAAGAALVLVQIGASVLVFGPWCTALPSINASLPHAVDGRTTSYPGDEALSTLGAPSAPTLPSAHGGHSVAASPSQDLPLHQHSLEGKSNLTSEDGEDFHSDDPSSLALMKSYKNISAEDKKKLESSLDENQKDVPVKPRANYTKYLETFNLLPTRATVKYENPYRGRTFEDLGEMYTDLLPSWTEARRQWGRWWELHIYLAGILYIFLSVISIAVILGIFRSAQCYLLGSFLCLASFGSLRAAYLLGDAYNFGGSYPVLLWNLLSNLSWCCLSASLSANILILLKETQVGLYLKHPIIFFIFAQFSCSTASSVIAGLFPAISFVILINQLFFPVWTWVLCLGYICLHNKLRREALKKQGELIRVTFTKLHIEGAQLPKRLPEPRLAFTVKLLYLSVLVSLLNSVLQMLGIFMFSNLLKFSAVEPWPWFTFQSLSRTADLGLGCLLFYVSLQYFVPESGQLEEDSKMDQVFPTSQPQFPDGRDTVSMYDVSTLTNPVSIGSTSSRNAQSLLYNENGFIRFRTDKDLPQEVPPILAEEEEDEEGSTHATAGSSVAEDVTSTPLSPFRHNLGCSSDTVNTSERRFGGSTCSSESAANSFDVTFYLQETPKQRPSNPTTLSLDLNLGGLVGTKPTQDITPDSAVYVDLPPAPQSSVSTPRFLARSLLNKIRGSSFSLNAQQGYELLVAEREPCRRSYSALRLLSREPLGDSGLIHDCTHQTTDQASQTEPSRTCKLSVLCQTDDS